jgi:hypothetical protein
METRGGNKSVEKKRSTRRVEKNKKCWSFEHSAVGSEVAGGEVAAAFTIIFGV